MSQYKIMEKISWRTHEYHHTEKTADWYWIVGIVSVSISIISIILDNVIFAILVLVSAFTLSLFASKRRGVGDVESRDDGVKIGGMNYPYSTLESFWVETKDGIPRMIFRSKKMISTLIVIFIEEVSPDSVKDMLSNYLPEEELSEPFLEKLMIYLGF